MQLLRTLLIRLCKDCLERHATFELVVDRKSKATDVIVMDFDGSVNGEKIQGGQAENYSLDLANSNFIPGFAEQLVGKKVGEEFDINVEFRKITMRKSLRDSLRFSKLIKRNQSEKIA